MQLKRCRDAVLTAALALISIACGLLFVNTVFLVWVRAPLQSKSFPRPVISLLSVPSRWLYPDTGRTNSALDIALIGDSYIEGDGDSFSVQGDYDYSVGHFLRAKTGFPFAVYAASGTYLPISMAFYQSGIEGRLWPLFDALQVNKRPKTLWLFFYEGNDLDDYISARNNGHRSVSQSLPWRVKISPLRYYLQRRWMLGRPSSPSPADIQDLPNRVCGFNGCASLGRLQSASPSLSDAEVDEAISYISQAVVAFASQHSSARVCFFYIPSPATIYDLPRTVSFDVSTGATVRVTREENSARSLRIREGFDRRLGSSRVDMVDLTESLQNSAIHGAIHGSMDADHFNLTGYKLFAEAIVESSGSCFPLASLSN